MDSEARRGLLLLSPTAGYAIALLAAPLAAVFAISFATQDFLTIDWAPSFANYREALSEPIYRELLLRSIRIAGFVTLATVLLAFPVAYFVSFHVAPERKSLWLFLITIPFWTSYLIRIFLWKVILGFNGVVNVSLMGAG
ncbi:MAG: ABC transporter permease, partial [Pseudomonadota bacterium]